MGPRHFIRWTPAAGLMGLFVVISAVVSSPPPAPSVPIITVADGRIQPKPAHGVGHLGCSAASCHGGGSVGEPGSESLTWFEGDPHRKAFAALHNAQSKTIAKNLAGDRGPAITAHRDERCLKCHAPEAVTIPGQRLMSPVGVGCESCHGPAGEWGTAHYQQGWKTLSLKQQAAEYGFYPLKDLGFRVRVCASCHVGDENRDVNHDLIAAGHPRLAFEYMAYHHQPGYQKHWKERDPPFESKAWEAGQIACARAAVALLKTRADRAGTTGHPWPELSEYACFSCHKELPTPSWKAVTASTHRLGGMRWGSWYNATLPWLADTRQEMELSAKLKSLTTLAESPTPDPKAISRQAADVIGDLDRWLSRANEPLSPRGIFTGLSASALTPDGQKLRDMEWDAAAQHYLGLAAARYAMPTAPRNLDPLIELRRTLRFPVGPAGRFDSPRETDPARVLKLFQDLHRLSEPRP